MKTDSTFDQKLMPAEEGNSGGCAPLPSSPSAAFEAFVAHEVGKIKRTGILPDYIKMATPRTETKTDEKKWRDNFVLPIAAEMKRRGIGEMRIKLTEKGTAVFELLPANDQVDLTGDAGGPNSKKDVVAG